MIQLILQHFLAGGSVLVVDSPLLIEAGLHRFMSEVVVVHWYAACRLRDADNGQS